MKALQEFAFQPAEWLPSRDVEMLERVRDIKFEDMEYTNENGFSVKIVPNPDLNFVMHMFHKIEESDRLDKPYVMICPNQHPSAYISVAEMLNTFNVSARNVHAFAMDEWADQDGNVAPLTICENSLFAPQGNSGDVWAIPPRSATIGPRDVYNARERFEMHKITFEGGACSWQRMISRIELYGPISMECPASICRLKPGVCYVSYDIARPITYWHNNIEDRHIF